jgi:thymidylate kinase
VPDVTILLQLSVAQSLRRLDALGERIDGMEPFLRAMRTGLERGTYTATIDATAPLDEVLSAVERVVAGSMSSGSVGR